MKQRPIKIPIKSVTTADIAEVMKDIVSIIAVVQFKKLDQKLMKSVTVKFLRELEEMLEPRNIVIEYDEETVDWLTKRGFTPSMGARPMARLINEKIKKPLSKQILFGKDVDLVKLSIANDEITIRTDKIQT